MDFRFERAYRGPIKAVIVDLAGTVVDYGCLAPTRAFVQLFERHGIEVTDEQVREPMGMQKRAHIQAMTRMPAVSEQWQSEYGRPCNEDDIDSMYEQFVPLQVEILSRRCTVIPGAAQFVEGLRGRGIPVAGTTGYNEQMMGVVLDGAREGSLEFDAAVCSEHVRGGRPAPWMIFRAMELLEAHPAEAVVKIGDTIADIAAGLNAGVWTVGVAKSGNMLGLDEGEIQALPEDELNARLEAAHEDMYSAGAHEVVDSVADCWGVIDRIERRLQAGGAP